MARAAVRAKQLEKAKAQPARAARPRGRRRHSGGGNPNQELFFVRLRRHQKWVYAVLAVVFGLSFVLVGVGSGSGGGLSQLYTGLFGGSGGSSISKASAEVEKNPAKGYRDLATAYESNGDNASAVIALQQYLAIKKKDAAAWAELGGLELSQGGKYASKYQNAQQAAQLADPSAPFQPGGTLGTALGSNAAYQQASQQASSRASQAYQQATTALNSAVTDYQKASNLHPRSTTYLQELLSAAVNGGNTTVAVATLRKLLAIDPHSPLASQWRQELKQITRSTQKAQPGNG